MLEEIALCRSSLGPSHSSNRIEDFRGKAGGGWGRPKIRGDAQLTSSTSEKKKKTGLSPKYKIIKEIIAHEELKRVKVSQIIECE